MFGLFDEVYDKDANIKGIIVSIVGKTYIVVWKNDVVGRVNMDDKAVEGTGRNLLVNYMRE